MEKKKRERDLSIDCFRFIGLTAIILAHSDIPGVLFQLRNFDVPLMVFVSGYSAYHFSTKSTELLAYVTDRFLRLVVPTWIFVTLYIIFRQIVGDTIPTADVVESYLMTGGPLGVWIIRIFFFMSLLTPVIVLLVRKNRNLMVLLIAVALILAVNEILAHYFKEFPRPRTIPVRMVFIFILYNCPYAFVLFCGTIWINLQRKGQAIFALACILFFLLLAAYHFGVSDAFVQTQEFKNPPMMYYLAYALLISSLLFLAKNTQVIQTLSRIRLVSFIGSHTLWIYLWHWLFLYCCEEYLHFIDQWVFIFLFVFIGATITTVLQVRIINSLTPMISPECRSILRKLFIG